MIAFDDIHLEEAGHRILSGFTLRVSAAEHVALQGPSGCGKSTVLRTLLGGHIPRQGTCALEGMTVTRENVGRIRSRVAYVPQDCRLREETVRDALELPFRFRAVQRSAPGDGELCALLKRLRLPADMLRLRCSKLSGGERQRVGIARALLLERDILLLDEPTASLDPDSKRAAVEALLLPGVTVLSVAHDPDWLSRCHRVLTMQAGRLADAGERPA